MEGLQGLGLGVRPPAARRLEESEQLPEPLFTPSTKAEEGHDEAIDFEGAVELIGDRALAEQVRDASLRLYEHARDHARERGVILADTKFEFGLDDEGVLTVGDEVLTPDSSRFWPVDGYEPGRGQPSFDKQYSSATGPPARGGTRAPPAPALPDDVVARTRELLRRGVRAHHRGVLLFRLAGARTGP